MALQPRAHFGVLVGAIVVQHHMDDLALRALALDLVEKLDKFLLPLLLHLAPSTLWAAKSLVVL